MCENSGNAENQRERKNTKESNDLIYNYIVILHIIYYTY